MESFPPTPLKKEQQLPKLSLQETAALLHQHVGAEDFEDLEANIETLGMSKAETEAKAQKELHQHEVSMENDADDLTESFIRQRVLGADSTDQALSAAMAEFAETQQKKGIPADQIGGRLLHAYSRMLENTQGANKDNPDTQAKITRAETIIGQIVESHKLGLGGDRVERGGRTDNMSQVVAGSKLDTPQALGLDTIQGAGTTEQAPAMFNLADMMKAEQAAQAKKKPGTPQSPS